jgi:hypothetical protein
MPNGPVNLLSITEEAYFFMGAVNPAIKDSFIISEYWITRQLEFVLITR